MTKDELDDKAIGVVVESKIKQAVGWFNSKLSEEREKVLSYYNGDAPKRQSEGSSSYISTDVYDAVEAMKAQLLETFASGYEIAKFDPQTPDDVEDARIATEYTEYVVHRQNEGYMIFNDVIHDGLTARVGIAKVYWEEDDDSTIEREFDNLTPEELQGMMAREDVLELEADFDEDEGTYEGKFTVKVDKSQVKIEVINPENFAVEPQAKSLKDRTFCVQRDVYTLDKLEEEYPGTKDKLKDYSYDEDIDTTTAPEVLARFQGTDNTFSNKNEQTQDELRYVLVYEAYIEMKLKKDKRGKYYKVVMAGGNVLEVKEVDRHPFIVFTPLPISHSFYGNNFAQRVIPTQNVTTGLTRSIVDHAAWTNNPRLQVLKGGLTNPRELLDNRLGGIVNTTRPDAITPIMQAPLNPFTFQTIDMIRAKNEQTTGISSLSQGLNKDAISQQNSQGMVQDLVSLSQTRQKIIARNFAQGFLIPLYLEVYRLVLENEKRQSIVELAGNWQEVDPSRWRERKSATVNLTLGYGAQDREADKRAGLLAMGSADPAIDRMIGEKGKYNFAKDILKLRGIKNVNDYLTPPEQLEPPQPDPMMIAELKSKEADAQAKTMNAQAAMAKVETDKSLGEMKLQLQAMMDKFQQMIDMREQERKEIETQSKVVTAAAELAMVESTPDTERNAIISPNS